MNGQELIIRYSIGVFIIVFLSGCVLNLLRQHYIFQYAGITFFFICTIIKLVKLIKELPDITAARMFMETLPLLSGTSACLSSMVLGFWLFPPIRKKFRN